MVVIIFSQQTYLNSTETVAVFLVTCFFFREPFTFCKTRKAGKETAEVLKNCNGMNNKQLGLL